METAGDGKRWALPRLIPVLRLDPPLTVQSGIIWPMSGTPLLLRGDCRPAYLAWLTMAIADLGSVQDRGHTKRLGFSANPDLAPAAE